MDCIDLYPGRHKLNKHVKKTFWCKIESLRKSYIKKDLNAVEALKKLQNNL